MTIIDDKIVLVDLKFLEDHAAGTNHYDYDDFNAMEYSGCNYDDAFGMGFESGATSLARDILKIFNK